MSEHLRVILTGASGMVGEGILQVCLEDENVGKVLVVTRKEIGIQHKKLEMVIHKDFFDLTPIEKQLAGYNACFFCAGVSSMGMKEEQYHRLTHTMTMNFAEALARQNPDLTFCYVSGAGTDSSQKGKMMWARVKGKTENDLVKLFSDAYNFRPAFMTARKDARNTPSFYKYLKWLFPVVKFLFPNYISSIDAVGKAMIHVSLKGYHKHVLEVKDIKEVGSKE